MKPTPTSILDYLRAGYPGLYIQSHEEARITAEFVHIARTTGRELYCWALGRGITQILTADGQDIGLTKPADDIAVLNHFMERQSTVPPEERDRAIYLLLDYHLHLDPAHPDPQILRTLKTALTLGQQSGSTLVITSCRYQMPPELEKEFVLVPLPLPDRPTLRAELVNILQQSQTSLPEDDVLDACAAAASGLTLIEATNAAALAIARIGTITPEILYMEKAAAVKKTGLMELYQPDTTLNDIGGMANVKAYAEECRHALSAAAKAYHGGLPSPKGSLMAGIPGTGKSAACKALAAQLGIPLLRVDVGSLMGSLVGESEANFRIVKQTAERIAPALMWFDEIEKAFPNTSGERDGGTLRRIFGEFLTWLSEKDAEVIVVATANDVSALDPALTRKGRWDEMFWVDIPTHSERAQIWQIMARRHRAADALTAGSPDWTESAATQSAGFTGAEIEAAYIKAKRLAFASGSPSITGGHLTAAIGQISPMSITQSDKLAELRAWSQGRCTPATPPEAPPTTNGHTITRRITKAA
jgi:ATP-dependent 26S proteasome regulatory subunit